jgi:hypothetical protein
MAIPADVKAKLFDALKGTVLALDHAYLGVGDFVTAITTAFYNVGADLRRLSTFDFNPKFKSRVINVPRGIEGLNGLYHTIKDDLLHKLDDVVQTVEGLKRDIQHGGSLHEPGENALQSASNFLSDIHSFLLRMGDAVTKIVEVASIITDIKQRIETAEDLFLPQGSTKKTVDKHYRSRIKS